MSFVTELQALLADEGRLHSREVRVKDLRVILRCIQIFCNTSVTLPQKKEHLIQNIR